MLFTSTIKNNKKFNYLYRKAGFIVTGPMVVYCKKTDKPYNMIGITTGKKIGNAVKRNRVKRIIRAAYREYEKIFPIGYDIVFVARTAAISAKSTYIGKVMKEKIIPLIIKEKFSKNKKG